MRDGSGTTLLDPSLDETWPLECDELGVRVTSGRPAWAPQPDWLMHQPMPAPEALKALAALKETVFGKETI